MNFERIRYSGERRKKKIRRVRKFSPGINNFIHEGGEEGKSESWFPPSKRHGYLLSSLLLNYVF